MKPLPNLELEFEILTLSHNITKLKKLGYRTADLQQRLNYCQSLFHLLNLEDSVDSKIDGIKVGAEQ